MIDDAELLRRYAEEGSETAFAEVVKRHINFVYSAALRRTNGNAHLAADVSQIVFTALARDARRLARHALLSGWLYTATRNAAHNAMREEQRRRAREQEVHRMHENTTETAQEKARDWAQLRPVLDAALDELGERDRHAVLLRFLEARPFAQVGAALGSSEDAARMRVERALEKLRALLARRGVTSTSAALSMMLANEAMAAAPAGLAASVTGAALAGGAAGASGAVTAAALFMKAKTTLAAAVAVLAVGVSIYEFNTLHDEREAAAIAQVDLQAQLQATQQRVAIADRQSAALQREVEAARAAKSVLDFKPTLTSAPPATSSSGSTPPTLSKEAKAVANGFHFGSMTREEARANSARNADAGYAALYRELNLTPAQSEQLRNLLLDCDENGRKLFGKAVAEARARNPNFDRADQFEVLEALNAQIEKEQQAAVRQAFGEPAAQALERYQATGPARVVANLVASALAKTEAPLASAQTEQLVAIVADHSRNTLGRVDPVALNVEGLMTQAQGWLQPAQLAALRTVAETVVARAKAEREFNTAPAAALKAAGK